MYINYRVGTIQVVRLNERSEKTSYVLAIDFGNHGTRISSGQIARNYTQEELGGMLLVDVMNFSVKRIARIKSEILVLGAYSDSEGVLLLQMTHPVENGYGIA